MKKIDLSERNCCDGGKICPRMARKISAQENTIQDDANRVDSRYECAICLSWLQEPLLTSCGHRFCKKCITAWLEKPNPFCPSCCRSLSSGDLFPDNCTMREIKNIQRPCPNAALGCPDILSPMAIDQHLERTCRFSSRHLSSQHSIFDCPFAKYGCIFQAISNSQLDTHSQQNMHQHLNMLVKAFSQSKSFDFKSIEALKLWDPPTKSASDQENGTSNAQTPDDGKTNCASRDSYNDELLRALYERIVTLEQLSREQGLQIERLTAQMNKLTNANCAGEPSARYSGGTLIWKIRHFSRKVQEMYDNPNNRFYSPDVYTSPFGYRFCARINIATKAKGCIGLHVHMMQSENDYHLDWPFRGCFKIWMLHRDMTQCRHDKIMSNDTILAFQRPTQEISPRGFGFLEYANINAIQNQGFISMDTLTIKLHIGIV